VDADGEPDVPGHAFEKQRHGERFLVGRLLSWLRLPLRAVQAVMLPVLQPLVLIGAFLLVAYDRRAAALLLAVPLYYFLTESFFILEWRVITPMHYGLFAGAAVVLVAAGSGIRSRFTGKP
jgi:hypothetical protein